MNDRRDFLKATGAARGRVRRLLGNVSLRSKLGVDRDSQRGTTSEAKRKYLKREYRKPWKLEA